MVCANFDDRIAVLRVQFCEHQRYADLVVQIPLRRQCACRQRQASRDHFLQRRLAVAAGNAYYCRRHMQAPFCRQQSECLQSVINDDDRNICLDRGRHDRSARPIPGSRFDKGRTVEVRSLQGNKQLALLKRARIGTDAAKLQVFALKFAVHCCRRFCQGALHHFPGAPASRRACMVAWATW